jgi:hypothetical protein
MATDQHRTLRRALRANAAFSSSCALSLWAAPGPVGHWIGVADGHLLIGLGVGLAAFAVHLVVTAARRDEARLRREALRHSVADLAWVAGSIGVGLAGWLSPAGNGVLAGVGVVVLALGVTQLRSLPRADVGRPELAQGA